MPVVKLEGVYAITPVVEEGENFDSVRTRYLDWLAGVLESGIKLIQFRAKTRDSKPAFTFAQRRSLVELMKLELSEYGAVLIVNDDGRLAAETHSGLHLGQKDLNLTELSFARDVVDQGGIFGISVGQHKPDLYRATHAFPRPHYLGVSTDFPSDSKKERTLGSMDLLKRVVKKDGLPVFAIGGVNKENLPEVLGTGVHGVAIIGALGAKGEKAREFHEAYRSLRKRL